MIYIDLLLIQIIIVIITDLSGFNLTWKSLLKFIATKGRMHSPDYIGLDLCDLCLTWWSCLIYLIITANISLLTIAYTLILAYYCNITKEVLTKINIILIKILNYDKKKV